MVKSTCYQSEDDVKFLQMTVEAVKHASDRNIRYPVLDALRFFLAFWVVMAHFGIFPLFAGVNGATFVGRTLVHGWSSIVFGTPAVIAFFAISGFCLHLPFRNKPKLETRLIYTSRLPLILSPLS